jgi:hypothetical protein
MRDDIQAPGGAATSLAAVALDLNALCFFTDWGRKHDFISHSFSGREGVVDGFIAHTFRSSTNRVRDGTCRSPYRNVYNWSGTWFLDPPVRAEARPAELTKDCTWISILTPNTWLTHRVFNNPPSPTPVFSPELFPVAKQQRQQ